MADFMNPAPEPKTALGKHRVLSSTAGIRVSPLCLGAMSIGDTWTFMGHLTKDGAFQLLDEFYKCGGNFIDTANVYHEGQSERWLGEWMKTRGNREQMVISTKFGWNYKTPFNPDKTPGNNNYAGNHRRSLHMSLNESLKNLQTDFIDVLYCHYWDYTTSIEELMDSLHSLVQQSKVMYLGISDTPAWVVAAANTYARTYGKTPFSVMQGRWNVLARDFERDILPMAIHFGVTVIPFDVLGGGKFQSEAQVEERKKKGESMRFGAEQSDEERKVSQVLSKIGKAHGVDSVTAVALAYVRSKSKNVIPLVGGRKAEHLRDNIKGLTIQLTKDEIKMLEDVKEFDVGFPGAFIGQDWHLTGDVPAIITSQGPVDFTS